MPPRTRKSAAGSAAGGSKRRKTSESSASGNHKIENIKEGEVRCVCNDKKSPPGRVMAECENCKSWQHVSCVYGVNTETAVEEPYYCPTCAPREPEDEPKEESKEESKEPEEHTEESNEPSESAEDAKEDQVPKAEIPENKVRQSALNAFDRIVSRQLVPTAIAKGLLPKDTNVLEFSRKLTLEIEQALYDHHALKPQKSSKDADVGNKYRDKFRSMHFNLKDAKNEDLQMRVVTRQLSADEFAILTSEQLLNPELQKLAESVRKESIRESVLKVDEAPRIRKTHKGEELVGEVPLNAMEAAGPHGPLDNSRVAPSEDIEAAPVTTGGESPRVSATTEANYDNGADFGVTYSPTPSPEDDDDDANKEGDTEPRQELMPVWDGVVKMQRNSDFPATAFHLGGLDMPASLWSNIISLDKPMLVEGKVAKNTAAAYLKSSAESRLIASFVLASDEAAPQPAIHKLFEYYASRDKVGVLPNRSAIAKDAYLIPFGADDEIPDYLQLQDHQKTQLDRFRQDGTILLGVFVLPPAKSILQHL